MSSIFEGAEKGDLARLVQPVLAIDEYRSKMGDDKDVVVLAVTVFGSEPAEDLVAFVEKSFDYVLDADVSSGETSDGNYMVFIELERNSKTCSHIMDMFTDIQNLTDQKLEDWQFTYYKQARKHELTLENLEAQVIQTPHEYEVKTSANMEESIQLNHLRAISGIPVRTMPIKDVQILDMQIAAGIR
jgi:hypothetical protein